MIQDRAKALEALTKLVRTVNATGGVLMDSEKNIVGCVEDHDWVDLADAYCLACSALGEGIRTLGLPDPAVLKEPGQDFTTPGCKALSELIAKFPAMKPEPEDSCAEDMACPKCGNRGNKARAAVLHYNLPDLLAAMEVDPITPEAQENLGLWIATGCRLFLAIDGAKDARLIHSAWKEFDLGKATRAARKFNSCGPRLFRLGILNNRPQMHRVTREIEPGDKKGRKE